MGDFLNKLGGALSATVDKVSPLLEQGMNYYTDHEAAARTYDLAELEAQGRWPESDPEVQQAGISPVAMAGIGIGAAVVLGTAVILSRR